jgi:hypothetical protein
MFTTKLVAIDDDDIDMEFVLPMTKKSSVMRGGAEFNRSRITRVKKNNRYYNKARFQNWLLGSAESIWSIIIG